MSLKNLIDNIKMDIEAGHASEMSEDVLKLCEAAEVMMEALEHYEDIPYIKVDGVDDFGDEVENEYYVAFDAITKADQICEG